MKKFFTSLFFISTSVLAAQPGDYQQTIRENIQAGLEACQLKLVSGHDPRLPYQIAARNVDQVVVREFPNGTVAPGLLIDSQSELRTLALNYSEVNGNLLLHVTRDFDMNDIAIDTNRAGRVAFTNSYWYGSEFRTDYVLQYGGARYVPEAAFYEDIDKNVVGQFVDFVCHSN